MRTITEIAADLNKLTNEIKVRKTVLQTELEQLNKLEHKTNNTNIAVEEPTQLKLPIPKSKLEIPKLTNLGPKSVEKYITDNQWYPTRKELTNKFTIELGTNRLVRRKVAPDGIKKYAGHLDPIDKGRTPTICINRRVYAIWEIIYLIKYGEIPTSVTFNNGNLSDFSDNNMIRSAQKAYTDREYIPYKVWYKAHGWS